MITLCITEKQCVETINMIKTEIKIMTLDASRLTTHAAS
jgi:hypothetical protein